eukprot:1159840-Pelagomonas_calceolata.AAC.8
MQSRKCSLKVGEESVKWWKYEEAKPVRKWERMACRTPLWPPHKQGEHFEIAAELGTKHAYLMA